MTLIDYNWDRPEREASVEITDTRKGYRIHETAQKGWLYHATRAALATLTLGLIGAAGVIWMLPDFHMLGDAVIARTVLSVSLLVVAAALNANGVFTRSPDVLEVDMKGRVLKLVEQRALGLVEYHQTVRFEEITRIDLADTSLMSELKSLLTRWDYGRITVRIYGKPPMTLLGGDMAELEPLLRRLRGDTGVA